MTRCDCGHPVTYRLSILRGDVFTFATYCRECAHREGDRMASWPGMTVVAFPIGEGA